MSGVIIVLVHVHVRTFPCLCGHGEGQFGRRTRQTNKKIGLQSVHLLSLGMDMSKVSGNMKREAHTSIQGLQCACRGGRAMCTMGHSMLNSLNAYA